MTSHFVPSDEVYSRPETSLSRITERARKQPRVDQNGKIIASTDNAGVAEVVSQPGKPANMVDALTASAERCGADLGTLLDSAAFCSEVAKIAPSDSAGLDAAVQAAMPVAPAPGMQPNLAQGAAGSSARRAAEAPKKQQGILEALQAQYGQEPKFDYSATRPID